MKLKIINYNLLNGFCTETPPYQLQKNRLESAARVLQKENPDILILTEAYLWQFAQQNTLGNIKKLFGIIYESSIPLPSNQFRWAPIVYSRFPIMQQDISISSYHRNAIRVTLKMNRIVINLDVVHPYPELTEEEKESFLKKVLTTSQKPYILAGDLNALSPQDTYDAEKLVQGYTSFMKNMAKKKVADMLKMSTIKTILAHGLLDTYRQKNTQEGYTVPTMIRSARDSAVRMDYIFCSPDFKVLEAGIIKNKDVELASDHYPVYALLELKV